MGKNGKGKVAAAGALSGVGAMLAGEVAQQVVSQLTSDKTKENVRRWFGGTPRHRQDVGYEILRRLAKRDAVPLAALPDAVKAGLLETLDGVNVLRRVRMVQYCEGRRSVRITTLGREALRMLKKTPDDGADADDATDRATKRKSPHTETA
ncbi:MAG TPA: hypothetical protein VK324_06235 [Tepidisphaeraceae bacterium]|nr:hypothetical protein [Tepidisphaeraceae bacterium]